MVIMPSHAVLYLLLAYFGRSSRRAPLKELVLLGLGFVELLEVAGDDGDGEREHQHPRHRAHAAEQLAQARPGTQVDIYYNAH